MTALASPEAAPSREDVRAIYEDVRAFYDAYFEALDDDRIEEWPDFLWTIVSIGSSRERITKPDKRPASCRGTAKAC